MNNGLAAAAFWVASLSCWGANSASSAQAAWEPSRPVEFVVPAGTGGGADQMARTIQGIISKYGLMKQSMVVVNKAGGAGGEGFLYIKSARGNPHKLLITLSNLFTTPLGAALPFNWRDLTPVAMLALDEFVLWVNAGAPYQSASAFLDAVRAAPPGQFKIGGTGIKQEDQIITAAIEKAAGVKFNYIAYRGGGEVAVQLAGNHLHASVNNPIEAVSLWKSGQLRPLCVFDSKPLDYADEVAQGKAWRDVPPCRLEGLDTEYLMLRGLFMPADIEAEQVDFYIDLMKQVRETPEWKDLMRAGAYNASFMTGAAYVAWVDNEEKRHRELMKEAGFLAPSD